MEIDELLRGRRWWRRDQPLPIGRGRHEVHHRTYTFGDSGAFQVEQGSEELPRRPGAPATRLVARGMWRVEGGRASLSFDGETWVPIEIAGEQAIRIGDDELVPAPAVGQLTGITR